MVLKSRDKVVFEKNVRVSPNEPFAETITLNDEFKLTDLYTSLVDVENDELLVDYQPAELDPVEELPKDWEGYRSPEELPTVEEVYLTGKSRTVLRSPRQRDGLVPGGVEARPGRYQNKHRRWEPLPQNGDYKNARRYLSKAIERLTRDYTRPSTCEALYLQGLTLKALELHDEAIDTLYRATWDYAYHS